MQSIAQSAERGPERGPEREKTCPDCQGKGSKQGWEDMQTVWGKRFDPVMVTARAVTTVLYGFCTETLLFRLLTTSATL